MVAFLYITVFLLGNSWTGRCQDWLNVTERALLDLRNNHSSYENSKSDILFLIDTSFSLSSSDFNEEKKFITNLLNVISVGVEATRVEVIPFGADASIFIDQVSNPSLEKNKCTFNEKFNPMSQGKNGYATNMKAAFQLAYSVCFGNISSQKRQTQQVKTTIILLTDGVWNWPWRDPSPVSLAKEIYTNSSVEVFALGIGSINYDQLKQLVKEPDRQAFHLVNFDQFSELATYLRGDPYEEVWQTKEVGADKCKNNCDDHAACSCGLVYGDYKCACPKGMFGSGVKGDCKQCPPSTYKDFVGYAGSCTACPVNSGHSGNGSISIGDCSCFKGYRRDGINCTIRRCEVLSAPANGTVLGSCNRTYLSECTFQCDEAYELSGSKTRQCKVDDHDFMAWSGTEVKCNERRCPEQYVGNAINYTGSCTTVELSYRTRCSYSCRRGFKRSGSETITCQWNKTWSPSPPVCNPITCPVLPTVGVGYYSPATCVDTESLVDAVCTLICPSGYLISSKNTVTESIVCQENGTWKYTETSPTCRDSQPPIVNCSTDITADNDPGTKMANVTWDFNFTDNSLLEDEPGITKDLFTIVLTIDGNNVDTNLPKLFEIGDEKNVQYTITDPAGNSGTCQFTVKVLDTEAPRFVSCPADIVWKNGTGNIARVNWDAPVVTDNSGADPSVNSNRQPGSFFTVPGSYEVTYKAVDQGGNENGNCSFRIILELIQCPLYEPPQNGALTCNTVLQQKYCTVQCQSGYDFVVTPSSVYYCSTEGKWTTFPIPFGFLPWPDCAKTENPSNLKMSSNPYFYYEGNCTDPNTQTEIKSNFISFLRNASLVPSLFCQNVTTCNTDTVKVHCGSVSAAERRRKRSTTMQVTLRYDYVFTNTGLNSGTNDAAGQAAFNAEKERAKQTRTTIYNSLKTVDWGGFQASSGLELKDKNVDNFNLGEVEAYCSADGAVVRKCDEADFNNCANPPCMCTKTKGTITKCTRCPIGTYYDSDADDCVLCPEGTYSPSEGALQCKTCPDGTWTVGTRQANFSSCTDNCGPGFYSSTGVAKCFRCPIGTYSSDERNKACINCPIGTSTVIDASKGIEDCGMQCAPGTYAGNAVEPCLPCPVGTYQPESGQIACLPCPGQQSTHGTGASSVDFCGEVDTCVSRPCMNGGTCVNTKESYRCDCAPGYNGVNCEKEINECLSSPCYQSSTCVNKVNEFKCLCPDEYTGGECDLPYSLCNQRKPCVNGVCIDKAGNYDCQCPVEYSETFCEMNINECASNPCQNNGVCISGVDSYTCKCQAGYSGVNCQFNIDDCAAAPCKNGGTCVDGLRSYSCQCPKGYTGANCEHAVDWCVGQPCKNGGTCVNALTGYRCLCKPTYYGCRCTQVLSSDYDLSFQVRVVKSYSKIKKTIPEIDAITVAFWIRTSDTNPGTVISYATKEGDVVQDNAFVLQEYASFVLSVNNQTVFTGLRANDGQWHHVAITWESAGGTWHAYKDGVETKASSVPFQKGQVITGGGVMILGQDQDELGGGFNTEENLIGDVSQMNVFDYVLSANDIYNLVYSCDYVKGNIAAWADFREQLFGEYHVTDKSYACDFSAAQRQFHVTYKFYISGSDDKVVNNVDPESCALSCLSESLFICRSFEFDNTSNTCRMSAKSSVSSMLARSSNSRFFELNCLKTLGVSTGRLVLNDDMTASSQLDPEHAPSGGRLNYQNQYDSQGRITQIGGWSASTNDVNQWLQIKFSQIYQISGVASQGSSNDAQWVKAYKLEYSTDGSSWIYYSKILTGNTDQNTVVRNELYVFQAMYLRFRPQTWNSHITMRVEVYGCSLPIFKPPDSTDECSSSPCQNSGTCVNRYNDHICLCASGYHGKNCETASSCSVIGAPIYGTVSSSNNNAGSSLHFTCNSGYVLNGPSSRTCTGGKWTGSHPWCLDKNECKDVPCNQWCQNTNGGYVCHCHQGYELQGSTTCVDINECSFLNGGCSHTCHNSAGSFTCSCPTGMELDSGKRSCKDIDECAFSNGGCEHSCVNTYQSFYCVCRQGYALKADKTTCEALSCPSLSSPSNGNIALSSSNFVGSTATYSCNSGYKAAFSSTRYCQADGQWSGGAPSCIRVYCPEIGQVEHATRVLNGADGALNVFGTTVTFTCDANYRMPENVDATRTCQGNGTWSGTQPRCVASFCSPVPVPDNGAVQGFRYELGATLRITCNNGYNLVPSSSSFRTCISDGAGGGLWSGHDPACELVDCGDPGDPYGGYRNITTNTKYQSIVTYTCKPDHHLEGQDSQVCQANGIWSGSKPVCLARSCGNPGVPNNGKKNSSSYQYGDSIKFECNVGYTLQGSAVRTCEDNGLWTGSQPTCQIVNCGDPGTPANGVRYGDVFTYRSTILLECDPQYKLFGDLTRTCQASGSWTGSQPTCQATSCGKFLNGPSGTVNSSNYPANYDDNEYCTWQIQVPVNKKIRLDFAEFKTESGKDYLMIYDTNHFDKPNIVFDGTTYKPPPFTSSGNVLRVRFISDGATTKKGFSFSYQQVDTSCGGVYEDGSGRIISPGYPNGYANNLDCVWLVYRTTETAEFIFTDFATESTYDTVAITSGRFGDTVLSSGWGGHSIPSGSFTTDTYLWIRFTTNGGNSDSRFHAGWTGTYQKYWPYVSV